MNRLRRGIVETVQHGHRMEELADFPPSQSLQVMSSPGNLLLLLKLCRRKVDNSWEAKVLRDYLQELNVFNS